MLKSLSIKLAILSIVLFAAIPTSIQVSNLMYSSYNSQIEQTVKSAEENKTSIVDKKSALSKEDSSWMDKVGDALSGLTSKIKNSVSDMIQKGRRYT